MVYPAFGVLYAKGISGFSDLDSHQRRNDGDRTALWFFTIALISTCMAGLQNYMFGSTAATLTAKVRSLCFQAILRQDSKFRSYMGNFVIILILHILGVEFFDKDENSSGGLTGSLSDNAQKINGLAGITLGT
jgi:ATP-binding cassette subfamily B (MDR/TAP) protein 1